MTLKPKLLAGNSLPAALAAALDEARLAPRAWGSGNLGLLDAPLRVSIGGSRQAERWALDAIEGLASALASRGACIVSGGAVGTDMSAHRGALGAGGTTIIVLPVSLRGLSVESWRPGFEGHCDPRRTLFLSLVAPGDDPRRGYPLVRNRLVAALGQAAVAGQTGVQGGTTHFLRVAMELRRPAFVLRVPKAEPLLAAAYRHLRAAGAATFRAEDAYGEELPERVRHAAVEFARAPMTRPEDPQLFDIG